MALTAVVMSDTHGVLRPQVQELLKHCDCVLHAGDFDDEDTLNWVAEFAPLYAVCGNNDWELRRRLPQTLRFKLEGVEFLMIHDQSELPHPLPDADVIVFGHSHRYFCAEKDGRLWLNPGSCGRPRFGGELSAVILRVDGTKYTVEKISISPA